MKRLLIILLLMLASSGAVAAEVVKYVNDYLLITLRSGPGTQYKIEKNLPTGTRVTVLESSEDGNFSRVRTDKGQEGWALNQYLVSKPVARLLLKQAQDELATLKQQHARLQQTHDELSKQSSGVSDAKTKLDQQVQQLTDELTTLKKVAERPLQLEKENDRLTKETVELKNRLRLIEEKNAALEDSEARQWFAIGAFVLVLGIILGLLLPKLRPRRSDDAWAN